MDYTTSDANVVHGPTTHRMHQQTAAVPTAVSAADLNMVIWSLMELLDWAGVAPAAFNPDSATTYQRLLQAVQKVAEGKITAFTPALHLGGSEAGIAYTARSGWWARRGDIVEFRCYANLSGIGAATGDATMVLTGLPDAHFHTVVPCHVDVMLALTHPLSGFLSTGTNVVDLRTFTAPTGQGVRATEANFQAGSVVYLNGSYRAAA